MGKRAEMGSVPQHSAPTAAHAMHTAQDGWKDSWEEAASGRAAHLSQCKHAPAHTTQCKYCLAKGLPGFAL